MRSRLYQAGTLELATQDFGVIRDVQRPQSDSGIVAVAALVKPVVAIGDRVQRSIRARVGLAGGRFARREAGGRELL